jgi:HEAT repeat protein
MKTNKTMRLSVLSVLALSGLSLVALRSADAGRGGSRLGIQRAVASGSVDAIQAELERTELLVCPSCVNLVKPLIDNDDYRIRKVAAWWLARRGASEIRVQMLTRLSQPDSIAARNAADVLGEFHYVSSIPALGAALSNPAYSGEARAAMARALGQIRRPAVIAPLQGALGAEHAVVRSAALAALREIKGVRDGSAIVPLVGDGDANVRADAAITLGTWRSTAGAEALVNALASDPSSTVRKNAAWALGEMRASSAVAGAALQAAAAGDASPLVRSLASVALTKLTR